MCFVLVSSVRQAESQGLDHECSKLRVFDLGIELMRQATKSSSDDDIDIDLFLDGLLLALLISVYLRIANFSQFELGRNLERGPVSGVYGSRVT